MNIERVKDKSLYINFKAEFKRNELIKLIVDNKISINTKYSEYIKMKLSYGYLNMNTYNSIMRDIKYNGIRKEGVLTTSAIIQSYREYLLDLKAKREEALKEALRKLDECEDMLDFIEGN